METVLMIVTLVSLVLAVGMSVLAWRLLRDDRLRSNERSDALREMAAADVNDEDDAPEPDTRRTRPAHIEEARRNTRQTPRTEPSFDQMRFPSEDEDADLGIEWDAPLAASSRQARPRPAAPRRATAAPVPEPSFGATEERGAPGRRWIALAAAAAIMAGATSVVYVRYRPEVAGAIPGVSSLGSAAPAASAHPIELLSLRHGADGDGAFTVTGLVQNPIDGRVARHVVAVVYVFDRDGHYFASGKAALDFTSLQPGEESPFVVRIPNAGRISRYRVGFRSEEGGVVSHVDRRGQLPGGTTGDTIETRPAVAPATATRGSEGL